MRYPTHHKALSLSVVSLTLILSACGESGTESGGGAGDPSGIPTGEQDGLLIQPFVGIFDLEDGWNGLLGDRAFLAIREPGTDGTAEAALIDIDDFSNCVPNRPVLGEVRKDPFSTRIFMDDIALFDQAELFLDGATAVRIEFTDLGDIDNDGSNTDIAQIQATRVGVTELDLGDPC